MSAPLAEVIRRFPRLRVAVVGDAMLDVFLYGSSHRLCREAPVPAVDIERRHAEPGGAANTAANVRSLGGGVQFLAVVGDDADGAALHDELAAVDVVTDGLLVERGRATIAKQRVVSGTQILLRLDRGDTTAISLESENRLMAALESAHASADALVVSDYGYGTLTPRVVQRLRELQRRDPRVLLVDAKDVRRFQGLAVTAVKPNYDQALEWLRLPRATGAGRAEQLIARGHELLKLSGAELAAVTLDADGAVVFERDRPPHRAYARPVHHARTTGAGDTFAGAFTLALAAGAETPVALELASAAAAVVVGKDETALCSAFELRQRLFAEDKPIADRAALEERVRHIRRQGRRIVFTNGCFDILHRGHVAYLNRAKTLGDILIVAVNSDESVRRLKGRSRPVNGLQDRLQVLEALSCVDHLVAFDEDTPEELIRVIRPDVFVKGGDYTPDTLPEAGLVRELGGEVRILPLVPERSTSGIIARIAAAHAGNGSEPPAVAGTAS